MLVSPLNIMPVIGLAAVLAVGPVAPEAGNIIYLTVGACSLLFVWPSALEEARRPIGWMPLVGLTLLAIAYSASVGFEGLIGLVYFAPLFAIWPLTTLLRRVNVRSYAVNVAILALCGVSAAAVMAIQDVQMTGTDRAGGQIANPIHFADVALLVGFLAPIGLAGFRSRWRFVFLLGPVMSAIAVSLSGTRGAILAVLTMSLAAVVSAASVRLINRRLAVFGLFVLIGAGFVLFVIGGNQVSGIQRVLADIKDTLANGVPTDTSTTTRLRMYLGGFRAFLESPLYGHGTQSFTIVANKLADAPFGQSQHLHNDIVDMAAGSGVLGLIAFVLFLAAPIAEALRAPPSPTKPFTIALTIPLVSGFFVMGLTNAMFGILTVTTTFAAICVIVGMMSSRTAIYTPIES